MKKDMNEWIYQLSNSGKRFAMPILSFPGIEIINKEVRDVVTDGSVQYECMKALSDRYPAAAALTVMDLSIEAEVFGSPVTFSDDEVPTVTSRIVDDEDDIKSLSEPMVGDGRTFQCLRAAELAVAGIKDRPVFGSVIGPFSLAGRLMGMTEIMIKGKRKPEMVNMLMDKATAFIARYASAFKNTGVNGIVMAEPAAGLLSPVMCEEFSSKYVKKIVDSVQDENFIVILHNCGNTVKLVNSMISTGAKGLHFGNAIDLTDVMPLIPWGRFAAGNIDPVGVFRNGTPDDIRKVTWDLLEKTAIYKNYVISSGCDIPQGTKLENIDAFYDTVQEFNEIVFKEHVA